MNNDPTSTTHQQPDILDGYILRPQLAAQLGKKNPRTLHRWEQQGYGPPVTRIGKLVLYSVSAVRSWIASQEHGAASTKRRRTRSGA